jgi:hypothetical protein
MRKWNDGRALELVPASDARREALDTEQALNREPADGDDQPGP